MLRASVLSKGLGVVEEVLQQVQGRAPDIINRLMEFGHVACLLDMDFRRAASHLRSPEGLPWCALPVANVESD